MGQSVTFCFTIKGTDFAVGSVLVIPKAGPARQPSTICGLSCNAPTAADVTSLAATRYKGGEVVVQWETASEVDNLGFNVYREQNGKRTRLNPEIVAGSALLAGPNVALQAGNTYLWPDATLKGKKGVQYWLEEVDLSGKSTWHGPVALGRSTEALPPSARGQAQMLSQLAANDSLRDASTTMPEARSAALPEIATADMLSKAGPSAGTTVWQNGVKISVKQEGWYRVSQAQLVAAGIPAGVNPRNLQLYVDGREIPINVIGEQDGKFNPDDAVEFYGIGLDTPSTDTRVYWLVAGTQAGQRIAKLPSKGSGASGGSFAYTVQRKDRTTYVNAIRNGEAENYYGGIISGAGLERTIQVQHLAAAFSRNATLEVFLQGYTLVPHQVRVLLNGSEVGVISFANQEKGALRLVVPVSLVREGDNAVRLVPLGGSSDLTLLDQIRLTYPRAYRAAGDTLRLPATGGQQVTIDGFSSGLIRVLDVTNPDATQEVMGHVRQQGTGYAVTATVPGFGARQLLVLTEGQIRQPASVAANQPSSWRSPGNQADLVIITRRDLAGSLEALRSLRASQGLRVGVVDVEDIYDEFSYGHKSPAAIKEMLRYAAMNWAKRPGYVLLAGDASYDPRNYSGLGDFDLVPTKLLDTEMMEAPSDDWFADFNDDGLAEMSVGRLPVRTAQETLRIVEKIIRYEASSWQGGVLLVADRNGDFDFEGASAAVRGLLPADVSVEEVFRGRTDDATARQAVRDGINRGPQVVNYAGHGGIQLWNGNLLTNSDTGNLVNREGLSLFVSMTCLNGYFHAVAFDSLAEALLKAESGAVASWSSSAMTGPEWQALMNQEVIRQLYAGQLTIGEATVRAKASVSNMDVRRSWILLGDPTMRLK